MKLLLLPFLLLFTVFCHAQDCEYTATNSTVQKTKTTKDYLISEKIFGGTASYIFFALSTIDEIPVLNLQMLSKSKDFPKAYCLDKASKIYFQLTNGKIITLISAQDEQCANLIYDSIEKNNIRILSGTFYFSEGSLNDLEKHPVSLMKIKYASETVDYTVKKEITSELNGKKYQPEKYFMNFLKCIQ